MSHNYPTHNSPQPHQDYSQGQQDWVCFKCHNLNFSFRKKCNRCKMQSRSDNQLKTNNQQIGYQDYYYYQYYYQYPNGQLTGQQGQYLHKNSQNNCLVSPRKSQNNKQNEDGLPSVSPLLKKCMKFKNNKSRKNQQSKGVWNIVGEELWAYQDSNIESGCVDYYGLDDQQSNQVVKCVKKMIL